MHESSARDCDSWFELRPGGCAVSLTAPPRAFLPLRARASEDDFSGRGDASPLCPAALPGPFSPPSPPRRACDDDFRLPPAASLSPTACMCERRRLQRLPAVTRPIPCQPCWTLSSSLTPSSPFATALPKPMHRRGVAGRSRSLGWGLLLVRCPPPPSPRVTSVDPHPCADDAFEFVGFRFQRSRTLALALTTDVDRYYNNNENSACHSSRD